MAIDYCEYLTGLPPRFFNLLVAFETTGEWCQFYVDGTVEVDWGTGHFLTYGEGIVYGKQLKWNSNNPVIVRAEAGVEESVITKLRFGPGANWDNVFLSINILKATDLIDATKLCYRLESLHTFTFFGNNQIESFESAWEDCTELTAFYGMDTTRAVTFKKAWKNANKLRVFPNIYARECLTVEAAWMGCTSMEEFPVIDVSNCKIFKNAWRGNVKLDYFPYIDTGAGEDFDHAWAYTTALTYFPALDFRSALIMDHAFAYMKRTSTMPFIDCLNATSVKSTFEQMLNLECISGLDTNGVSSRDFTDELFHLTPKLVRPNDIEQSRLRDGWRYTNPEPCYYDAGRSTFFVHCNTTGVELSVEVIGGDFEIDWGDGLFLPYNEGIVTDIPIESFGINIRSEEQIDQIRFLSDTMKTVEIKRGRTLTNISGMCKGLEALEYFEMLGGVNTTDYSHLLEDCINLIDVGEMNVHTATTLERTFYNCESLIDLEDNTPVDMSECINFSETFYGCSSFTFLPKLITTKGENFTRMLGYMTSMTCLHGIDTRQQTSTVNMFDGTNNLGRPNINEIQNILAGTLYDNFENCDAAMQISFTSTGNDVQLQVNYTYFVDWGDGNYVEYASNETATHAVTGTAFMYSTLEASNIIFVNDEFVDVTFINTDMITSMRTMFLNKDNIRTFTQLGNCNVVDYQNAFNGSGLVTFNGSDDLSKGVSFNGMFKGTTNLQTISKMNTWFGIDFENMFRNSGITCFEEINTCNADFPPSYVQCSYTDTWVCSSTLLCSEPVNICPYSVPCDTEWEKFGHSTMFDGTNITSPDTGQQDKITNRFHYIGVQPC